MAPTIYKMLTCKRISLFKKGVLQSRVVRRVKMCSGSEAGSYLRLIDSCITQLKAQGPSRTCNESKEEEGVSSGVLEPNTNP